MKVTIVVPTYNEQDNIGALIKRIKEVCNYNILVVDDGMDATEAIAWLEGAVVIRGRNKGLGQAIIDGVNYAKTPIVLVMDADLSHPPSAIPSMVEPLLNGYDMTIGSRYCSGGGIEGWEISRKVISRVACLLALPITTVRDSTSGFFALRKEILDGVRLEGRSWKTMLEVLIKAKPLRVLEVPIIFRVRQKGKSKFNKKQVVAYLKHLVALALHRYNRFLRFCIVGGSGAVITFVLTWVFTEVVGWWYMASMVIAVAVATVTNFIFNSVWTFSVGKDMNDADYEWNAYYAGNLIQKWWKHQITQKVKGMVSKKGIILDIGCGSSPIALEIGNLNYIGVDSNKKKIAFMKERLPKYKYEVVGQELEADTVMAIEVIEHMTSDIEADGFIKGMVSATKDGGMVIIATPDYSKLVWRIIEKVYGVLMPSAYANDHRVRFDEQMLISRCKTFGLKHIKTERVLGCDMVCLFRKS